MTRPVVTDGTARYRMKGMDITFPLIPRLVFCGLSCLDITAPQRQAFFQKVENAEI